MAKRPSKPSPPVVDDRTPLQKFMADWPGKNRELSRLLTRRGETVSVRTGLSATDQEKGRKLMARYGL